MSVGLKKQILFKAGMIFSAVGLSFIGGGLAFIIFSFINSSSTFYPVLFFILGIVLLLLGRYSGKLMAKYAFEEAPTLLDDLERHILEKPLSVEIRSSALLPHTKFDLFNAAVLLFNNSKDDEYKLRIAKLISLLAFYQDDIVKEGIEESSCKGEFPYKQYQDCKAKSEAIIEIFCEENKDVYLGDIINIEKYTLKN